MGKNFCDFRLSICQSRLEIWILFAEFLLSLSQLFLHRTDLSERATRFEGFGKYLLTEFQLLLKYLGSCGRARIHDDF